MTFILVGAGPTGVELAASLAQMATITMRGQVESMQASFSGLSYGLAFAVVLVYLLMVINFQSWSDPFIIITALPGAFCGIVWMLFLTGTTFSVPSLMGAIMSVGVATANSILLISFANEQLYAGHNAIEAALEAGSTRSRPVLMTALAMLKAALKTTNANICQRKLRTSHRHEERAPRSAAMGPD
jgi:multidrug efflux pump subunit AcrB